MRDEALEQKFRKLCDDYLAAFEEGYPYCIGIGYPGKTTQENIRIIEECLKNNKPVEFNPQYEPGVVY